MKTSTNMVVGVRCQSSGTVGSAHHHRRWAPYRYGHGVDFALGLTWVMMLPGGFAPFTYAAGLPVGEFGAWVPCAPRTVVGGPMYARFTLLRLSPGVGGRTLAWHRDWRRRWSRRGLVPAGAA